jgi:hypothetical protein
MQVNRAIVTIVTESTVSVTITDQDKFNARLALMQQHMPGEYTDRNLFKAAAHCAIVRREDVSELGVSVYNGPGHSEITAARYGNKIQL